MKVWRDNCVTKIQTPAGLAFALSFNAGIRNTMVQLIEHNRSMLQLLEHELMEVVKVMKDYFRRANHIYYTEPDNDSVYETSTLIDNIKTLRFRLGLQSFTGIDEPYIYFKSTLKTKRLNQLITQTMKNFKILMISSRNTWCLLRTQA